VPDLVCRHHGRGAGRDGQNKTNNKSHAPHAHDAAGPKAVPLSFLPPPYNGRTQSLTSSALSWRAQQTVVAATSICTRTKPRLRHIIEQFRHSFALFCPMLPQPPNQTPSMRYRAPPYALQLGRHTPLTFIYLFPTVRPSVAPAASFGPRRILSPHT
jgi:hypothetical protein